MKKYYGLYQKTVCYNYHDEGGGSHEYEHLHAIGTDPQALKKRWNKRQQQERDKIIKKKMHASYLREVPPDFSKSLSIKFNGNTGGGYSSVDHTVEIRPVKQFDDKPVAK